MTVQTATSRFNVSDSVVDLTHDWTSLTLCKQLRN